MRLEAIIGDAVERITVELGRIAVSRAQLERAECSARLMARLETRERELKHRQRQLDAAMVQAREMFLRAHAS